MKRIRLSNYRCFGDTGDIDLKSVCLFVGANNSGKSSILRFFPLLKNSIGCRRQGVMRWCNRDVDFKDFRNTLKSGTEKMKVGLLIESLNIYRTRTVSRGVVNKFDGVAVEIEISSEGEHFDRIVKYTIECESEGISIVVDMSKVNKPIITVNGESYGELEGEKFVTVENESLLPRFFFKDGDYRIDYIRKKIEKIQAYVEENGVNTEFIFLNRLMSKERFTRLVTRYVKNISETDRDKLYTLSVMSNINQLVDSINLFMLNYADDIRYIGPLHAAYERYYRFRNDRVDEISSDGSNIPMFLNTLSDEEKKKFKIFTKNIIKMGIKAKNREGHIEILGTDIYDSTRNLIDVGSGYTQILPIVASIWDAVYRWDGGRGTPNRTRTIVIEQPELHLHPRMQEMFALIVFIMVGVCKKTNKRVCFLIETHSERILNCFGEYIEGRKIKSDEVAVYLVEAKEGNSTVRRTGYSDKGYLKEWPANFI